MHSNTQYVKTETGRETNRETDRQTEIDRDRQRQTERTKQIQRTKGAGSTEEGGGDKAFGCQNFDFMSHTHFAFSLLLKMWTSPSYDKC